ncbi:hypothetical protein [Thermovibrio ammonificans]|jgi:hypothetical protein|uniref:Uncharacterized protein n=1 Tax=Thermovibrio ammonificans (strain DSM 15698 / JCM 12110 / HB-1) TaxID=648996 RepID=E8T5T3_THEA1|nr:hypothetical protein [Thermovibrio ammonificans]ADU97659.1 hypothetical protein Theam_1703 [Thermovibrio ammonificans HB-1]
MKRKDVYFRSVLLDTIERLAKHSPEADLMRKLMSILIYGESDSDPKEIARKLGLETVDLHCWIDKWNEQWADGLVKGEVKNLEREKFDEVCRKLSSRSKECS